MVGMSSCSLSDSNDKKGNERPGDAIEFNGLDKLSTGALVLSRSESSAPDTDRSIAHLKSTSADVPVQVVVSAERFVLTALETWT